MSWLMKAALVTFIVLMGAVFLWQPLTMPFSGAVLKNDFVLQSARGPVDSRNLQGKVLAVVFAHVECQAVCIERIKRLAQAYELLSADERNRVGLLLISTDPARDTPERIQAYADQIHPSIVGLTGTADEVRKVADGFAAVPQKEGLPGENQVVAVSTMIHIVDAEGTFASVLNEHLPPEQIAKSLRSRIPTLPTQLPPGR